MYLLLSIPTFVLTLFQDSVVVRDPVCALCQAKDIVCTGANFKACDECVRMHKTCRPGESSEVSTTRRSTRTRTGRATKKEDEEAGSRGIKRKLSAERLSIVLPPKSTVTQASTSSKKGWFAEPAPIVVEEDSSDEEEGPAALKVVGRGFQSVGRALSKVGALISRVGDAVADAGAGFLEVGEGVVRLGDALNKYDFSPRD